MEEDEKKGKKNWNNFWRILYIYEEFKLNLLPLCLFNIYIFIWIWDGITFFIFKKARTTKIKIKISLTRHHREGHTHMLKQLRTAVSGILHYIH